ncbi:hypothetical protein [Limnohabitans radicicola]|uniref:Lipoprotein n=1 Tax=Limnohabitans radicicola TaxID=2771427 RepID=A0A927FJ96_9BURK|nr:hypothetical protein [Limnohabitans radicicola]MBD8051088.1 hypothetical protein [Limnohabitans radicicola]
MKTPLTQRIAKAAMATLAVALFSGCAYNYTGAQRLERWTPGENKDLALVLAVRPASEAAELAQICKEGTFPSVWKGAFDPQGPALTYVLANVCPSIGEWRFIRGFVKSDFTKGPIMAAGLIKPGLEVNAEDIVEASKLLDERGQLLRPALVTRVVRKNALKERDPTCYWDGQSGRLDGFATGGVVCPAEGWDWREQKWAKK